MKVRKYEDSIVSNAREPVLSHFQTLVEKSTRSGVFLAKFEVFGNMIKHSWFVLYSFSVETKAMD